MNQNHIGSFLLLFSIIFNGVQVKSEKTNFVNHLSKLEGFAEKGWYLENIPFVEIPDQEIEDVYYYRWATHKRHLRYTVPGSGYIVTEFVNDPGYGGKFNSIPAASGHHIYESRWMKNRRYVQDYINFWTRDEGYTQYSGYKDWVADAAYNSYLIDADKDFLMSQQDGLVSNYKGWEDQYEPELKMYHISPAWDAMEYSCSSLGMGDDWGGGVGYRPSFNGEMYSNALSIAKIAKMNNDTDTVNEFLLRAESIREGVLTHLWDRERKFFYHMHREDNPGHELLGSREEIGFFPWKWGIPDNTTDHVAAWDQLLDAQGFNTKYGPTTCEVRSEYYDGDQPIDMCCWWNGNSWPYSTGLTLNALANLLRVYKVGPPFTSQDYVDLLHRYAVTQYKNGKPYVAECHSPDNDYWVCDSDRSPHYAHSTYVDNVIAELIGVQPQEDNTIVIEPLVPGNWKWFALENLVYHGHYLTIVYDQDGSYYETGYSGLQAWINGEYIQSQTNLDKMVVPVPPPVISPNNGLNKIENIASNPNGRGYPEVEVSYNGILSDPKNLLDGRIFYDQVPANRWSNFESETDKDWLIINFGPGRARAISEVRMYIFSDVVTNEGRCDCPKEILLEYLTNGTLEWVPVNNLVFIPSSCSPNDVNIMKFDETTTQQIRLTFTRDVENDYYIGLSEIEIWSSWSNQNNMYEAEDGLITGAKIEETISASSGAYVNVGGIDAGESRIQFSGVWSESKGLKNVNIYYATGVDENATQILKVNNQDYLKIQYPPTHGWNNFQNFVSVNVNLQKGNNVLIFNYESFDVQMDRIMIT